MKILSVIPCYSGNSNPYIKHISQELSLISDVVIFSPENIEGFNTQIVDKSLGHDLVYTPREYIISNLDNYDYFLYNEDDILINSKTLLKAIEINELISSIDIKYIVGLLRFELNNSHKEYTDLHPAHSIHRQGSGEIIKQIIEMQGKKYFEPYNIHSGNFILSKKQLKYLIDSNLFFTTPEARYVGILESGASDLYLNFTKLIPVDIFTELECHHMSNKYVYNSRKVTEEEIKILLNE
jgi:hypothetical protein